MATVMYGWRLALVALEPAEFVSVIPVTAVEDAVFSDAVVDVLITSGPEFKKTPNTVGTPCKWPGSVIL